MGKDWKGLSLHDVVQKLIEQSGELTDTTNYFQKFWARRRVENNHETVLNILRDLDELYNANKPVEIDRVKNTELYELINFNVALNESDSLNAKGITYDYFNFLKKSGLEHSAYNLIFEVRFLSDLSVNKDSLLNTLKFDTITEQNYWNTRNDAQWVQSYRDKGP